MLKNYLQIVHYLIEKQNVDIYIKGNYEKTLFHFACENGQQQIVEYLISKSANSNAKDEEYVIHYASFCGLPIVQYLIEQQNIDRGIKGRDEITPLWIHMYK